MNWQDLLDPAIQKFIQEHKDADVQKLALKKPPVKDWPYALIMDQIKARQKLALKVPLQDKENLIFPPSNLVEQASSWACASYKASLTKGESFADLTAGSGTDAFAFSNRFQNGVLIERDEMSASILAHNLKILGHDNLSVKNMSAEDYIKSMEKTDMVFIDPQRRDEKKRGIFDLSDCSPNILEHLPHINAKTIMIKTSPVLDIKKAISDLKTVQSVHIVEYDGDCKELLFILSKDATDDPNIRAVKIDRQGHAIDHISFTLEQEAAAICEFDQPNEYLYEPGPAFQKSGGYKFIAQQYGLKKLHPNTHLYTSKTQVKEFPGRKFRILNTSQANHKSVKSILPDMKANLTVRNFPMKAEDLKKKLKIKDGGDITLFACTDLEEQKIILKCEKI